MGAMTDTAPARWIDYVPLDDIRFAPRNPKGHDITGIGGSIDLHGMGELPLVDERTGQLVAGHGRIEALRARHKAGGNPPDGLTVRDDGMWMAPVVRGWSSKSDAAAESYLIGSNQWTVTGGWDDEAELLAMLRQLEVTDADLLGATGYDAGSMDALARAVERDSVTPYSGKGAGSGALAEQFLIPPLSVLDARGGWWRTRKKQWLELGFESGGSRSGASSGGLNNLAALAAQSHTEGLIGASRFDPVLAELIVRWYSPPGGVVLDPFAGGSVRGIVTSRLGRHYTGIDLRSEQVAWNVKEWERINGDDGETWPAPVWVVGDATDPPPGLPEQVDLVYSCPPYADLEHYSDDPADLSNMDIATFMEMHARAIRLACDRLRPDSFAVWVIGEARDKRGDLYGLVPHTIDAFRAAGLTFATEAVLLTMVGTAAIGAARVFNGGRSLTRVHQNVLVFCKGSRSRAAKRLGEVDVSEALAAIAGSADADTAADDPE